MKRLISRRERGQPEAMVPSLEIEDPSEELLSHMRVWEHQNPRQGDFLDLSNEFGLAMGGHEMLRLTSRNTSDSYDLHSKQAPIRADLSRDDAELDLLVGSSPTESYVAQPLTFPQRYPDHTSPAPQCMRSQSLPPYRALSPLSTSPFKANFQLFSQRCAPSPTSPSTSSNTPLIELSVEEAEYFLTNTSLPDSPVELQGSPVEPAPSLFAKPTLEAEPEASPYNRFATFTKSIHTLNANLTPIAETEEEAASRRSSLAPVYEIPACSTGTLVLPSTYSGQNSFVPSYNGYTTSRVSDFAAAPNRSFSLRSSKSMASVDSLHSIFSFEFSNSDTEKMYASSPTDRRKSSAPSLTDVSSVDDFDIDLDVDIEKRSNKTTSRRDAKLERFFGIRQYSISPELDSESRGSESDPPRPSLSIDDLDVSLACETDPFKREMITIHRSLISKCQYKQDAKLEKFFGCDKDQIITARKSSTGSRLAGHTDDLKFRSIGW